MTNIRVPQIHQNPIIPITNCHLSKASTCIFIYSPYIYTKAITIIKNYRNHIDSNCNKEDSDHSNHTDDLISHIPNKNEANNKQYKSEETTNRNLIRYGNELLIDHRDMKPISIAIVGESKEHVLRLCHSICSNRIISDFEFSQCAQIIIDHEVQCPYRTRLIPIKLNCFYESPDQMLLTAEQNKELLDNVDVWIIAVLPENGDIASSFFRYHGVWNNIISKKYPKSRRIIASVQPTDHLDEDALSYHLHNSSDVKIKHVALYSMV